MSSDSGQHRDRYDVTGNIEAEYVDAEQTVLKNKPGITDANRLQVMEEECLARAYEVLLSQVRVDTPITNDLIFYSHPQIFGELYAWAGRLRTVNISKPGIMWPPPAFLARSMEAFERLVLRRCGPASISGDDTFCQAVAEIQGEFLVIHPFREGNARTIKLVTDLLAAQTGRPLLAYDQSDVGRESYIEAASQAFRRNYQPMEAIIRLALATARRAIPTPPTAGGESPPSAEADPQ